MGCGQSKINLYPRRNKSGHKANGAKKTGATEKETDEEEGSSGIGGAEEATDDDVTDEDDKTKHLLPLVSHATIIEVSASQQNFFKMLDEKIEKGRDYDSSSESEIRAERDRRTRLVRDWQSKSQSSTQSQPSPPTPVRRRPPLRPDRDRPTPPPPRRCHSSQSHRSLDKSQTNAALERQDDHTSPVRRPQSSGGVGWKSNTKVAPVCQTGNKNDAIDGDDPAQKEAISSVHDGAQEVSKITYNPTFQTHSPAHAPHRTSPIQQQPYIAQIVNYPSVNPAPPTPYISPPESYQDPSPTSVDCKHAKVPRQASVPPAAPGTQSNIYYIHGNAETAQRQTSPDQLTQKQQTALHLQHYVAMKQAQQNMFSYLQRLPHGAYPGMDFPPPPLDVHSYDAPEDIYGVAYYAGYRGPPRPRSAPPSNSNVRPVVAHGAVPLVNQVSMFTHVTPVMPPYGQFPPGQFPQTEVQYYQQAQLLHNMYRPGSAGSAGTLTRYSKPVPVPVDTVECQTINIVRQKSVGQIVSLGGQDLGVYQNANDRAAVSPRSSAGGGPGVEGAGGTCGPAPPPLPPQRTRSELTKKSCDGLAITVNDKCKKSNGGAVKTRTKILKYSKSLDSKKD